MRNWLLAFLLLVLLLAVPARATNTPAQDDILTTGSITTSVSNAEFRVQLNAAGVVGFAVNGLTGTGATLALEYSNNGGTTWSPLNEIISGGVATNLLTTDLQFRVTASGHTQIRLRVSVTGTGTATAAANLSVPASVVGLREALPPGSNNIGLVSPGINPWPVQLVAGGALSGSNLAVTQATVPWVVNLGQVNGNTSQSAGQNGTLAVGGNQTPGSVMSTEVNPVPIGGSDYGGTPVMRTAKVDSLGNLQAIITAALPAGAATIGGITQPNTEANLAPGTAPTKALAMAGQYNSANPAPTNGQTLSLQLGPVGELKTGGPAPSGSAPAGNPLEQGCVGINAEPTAVSNGQIILQDCTLVGKKIVQPYANPENFVSGSITTAMTGTTSTSLVAAPGVNSRNYITNITCSNAHATVGTDIVMQDGSGGTTLYHVPAAPNYGGGSINFATPLRQPTLNTAMFVANVTTGASTKCSASGYKGS
jgi:hypothetical protein